MESSVQVMLVEKEALAVVLAVKVTATGGSSEGEEGMKMQVAAGGSQGCCRGEG